MESATFYNPADYTTKPTIYLDMDGVLADFDRGAEAAIGTTNTYKWEWIHGSNAFWRALDAVPDFFLRLPPMPDALLLFGNVRHLDPIVLTALPKSGSEDIDRQKREWIRKYFGADVRVVTCLTHEKPDYCLPGDILVDDRNVNAAPWIDRGGRYVLHTGAESTLEQLADWGVL